MRYTVGFGISSLADMSVTVSSGLLGEKLFNMDIALNKDLIDYKAHKTYRHYHIMININHNLIINFDSIIILFWLMSTPMDGIFV